MTELLHRDLTDIILGAYFEVYNHTSRTFPEPIFERAMIEELRWRGQEVTQQDAYQILYKGHKVGVQQLDLFVMKEVGVENKVAERITPLHKAQAFPTSRRSAKRLACCSTLAVSVPNSSASTLIRIGGAQLKRRRRHHLFP